MPEKDARPVSWRVRELWAGSPLPLVETDRGQGCSQPFCNSPFPEPPPHGERGVGLRWRLAATAIALLPSLALAQARLAGKFNDWTVYAHDGTQAKICFALAAPKASEPAGARRDPVFFYVSAWPKEAVKAEVSVKIGYPLRRGSDVTVTIGTATFKLFTKDDRAFVADPADEVKLVEAMKTGSAMVVQGTSERGTATKDTYSLSGVSQALQSLNGGC
jgi:hypothetical protein